MSAKDFGARAKQARLEQAALRGREMTKVEVGAALGVSDVAVGAWEAGQKEPNLERIEQLAGVLGVSPCWLAFGITELRGTARATSRAYGEIAVRDDPKTRRVGESPPATKRTAAPDEPIAEPRPSATRKKKGA